MLERIVIPGLYVYTKDLPKGCKGGLYQVHREILDVPSYQKKLLIECVSGKDQGLWFTCTLANFALRYDRLPLEPTNEVLVGEVESRKGLEYKVGYQGLGV